MSTRIANETRQCRGQTGRRQRVARGADPCGERVPRAGTQIPPRRSRHHSRGRGPAVADLEYESTPTTIHLGPPPTEAKPTGFGHPTRARRRRKLRVIPRPIAHACLPTGTLDPSVTSSHAPNGSPGQRGRSASGSAAPVSREQGARGRTPSPPAVRACTRHGSVVAVIRSSLSSTRKRRRSPGTRPPSRHWPRGRCRTPRARSPPSARPARRPRSWIQPSLDSATVDSSLRTSGMSDLR